LLAVGLSSCASLYPPPYHGPVSDHFDGKRFHNFGAGVDDSIVKALKRELHRPKGRPVWRNWQDASSQVPPRRVGGGQVRVTFVNHATVLIQADSLNILTDPIWSFRASPLSSYGPPRHRPPGVRFEDLPPIDLVLVSHNHYDHMDLHTLRELARTFHPRILVGLGNARFLERNGITGAEDMDWWQSVAITPTVRVSGTPAQHFSARWINDRWRTLWLGFVIDGPSGKIYFAGDTGFNDFFRMVAERFAPFRLVILPIAPGVPQESMGPQHMSAADAVKAYRVLGAPAAVGMHFGTFQQGDEKQEQPTEALEKAIEEAKPCVIRFWALQNGEAVDIPKPPTASSTCRPGSR
jgi:L-ascorbate metabolism protein UlaG (beta-lactamase superfamily)